MTDSLFDRNFCCDQNGVNGTSLGPKSQHTWTFISICLLEFSEMILNDRRLKLGKSDRFAVLKKIIDLLKITEMGHFWSQNQPSEILPNEMH